MGDRNSINHGTENARLREDNRRLRKSSKRHAELYQHAPIGYFALSQRGVIRSANVRGAALIGADRLFLIGTLFVECLVTEDRPAFDAYRRAVLAGEGRAPLDVRLRRRDGVQLDVQLRGKAFQTDDGRDRLRLIASDISDRKALERQLVAAKETAERASQVKSQFLANMSHEIRTPLGAMLGFADLVLASPAGDCGAEVLEAVKRIHRNGQHLLSLVNDLLDLAKVEANELTVAPEEIDLSGFLEDLRQSLNPLAAQKGLQLTIRWDAAAPRTIISDPLRLRQVIVNLVGNAVKFTTAGSVTVHVKSGRRLLLDVIDTGCGIPAERRDSLFKPFSQVDQSTTRRFGGTGLGLYLSRRLAEVLGGSVALVSSEVGSGSIFRLALGLPGAVGVGQRFGSEDRLQLADLHGVNVLLAEDSPDIRAVVSAVLRKAGARVHCAENGQQAVRMVLDDGLLGGLDVVVMDVQMPILDGLQAASALKENGFAKPIVALTAHVLAEDRAKAESIGFAGYLHKPVDFNALTREIAYLTGAPRQTLQ